LVKFQYRFVSVLPVEIDGAMMTCFAASSAECLAEGRVAYTDLTVPERTRQAGESTVKGETGAGLSLRN
jgi:hypothetical protein